jgi:DNA-binding SARP family transcriptional activator/tetratricopeptide (TPR) repeat protein
MTGLELRFLGDFGVLRDGQAMPLPPSKKTRALLAYLCLNARRFRREQLCELLWEIPDDPRGSLRWSLSKLRRLVDDVDHPRIIADRASVGVDIDDVAIDVADLRALATNSLNNTPVDELEAAAARFRGNFLEGLEFPNFHDFHAWCVAEREQSMRDREALLGELVHRLADSPERALPHARALVGIWPYDEQARATLVRLLNAANHPIEAEQQFQLGIRMLEEAGVPPSGDLLAARRAARSDRPRDAAPRAAAVVESAPAAGTLVGREEEFGRLVIALDKVIESNRAEFLLLRGAPGIGKSRVLEAVAELARQNGSFILRASAFESDTIRPFALWIDSLRTRDSVEADGIFGGTDVSNRDRLYARLSDFVAREAADRPVVLIFDDVHWCDESSAAALHYVARLNRNRPLFGVLAGRGGELRDNTTVQQALRGMRRDGLLQELRLGPLPEAAVAALIDERSPGADSERLSRECGGNPLLAIELARAEKEGGGGGSLSQLIQERLARFDVNGAEVMRWAAVLSPRIDLPSLAELTGLATAEIGAVLESAEHHGMLRATEHGLRFSHDLIARAVYTDISPLRRSVMHRRVAERLEQASAQDLARASDLAHHAMHSEDPGLAARASVSAGRLCLRFFANDDAMSLAHKGLQLAATLPDVERINVTIELHEILLSAGPLDDWEAAAEEYAALAEQALDHGELAHARLGYHLASHVRWAHGHWAGAREQTLQAERVIRGGTDEPHIIGMAETAKCLAMLERDLSQADAMLMEAEALAKRIGLAYHAIPSGLGILRFHENRLDDAVELFQEARTLCKSAGDRINEYLVNEHLVMIDIQRGRYADAKARCRELLSIGERLREGSEGPFARALDGLCDYAIDDEADKLAAGVGELRIVDAKHRLACVLTRAAFIDIERGRLEAAHERATEALHCATALERATEMLLANAILSTTSAASGDDAAAAKHADEVARLETSGAAAWCRETCEKLDRSRPRVKKN